jgi:hypothetical protein
MQDDNVMTPEQDSNHKLVLDRYNACADEHLPNEITADMIASHVKSLRTDASAGWDGISPGHLVHCDSTTLYDTLAKLYTIILSRNVVPSCLSLGTIIPVLEKSTSNPNAADSYRPITLSTVFSKLLESLMMPPEYACDSQYGFRGKRSTVAACTILNDVAHCYKAAGSPVFVCSLDAQKCFDNIWHSGLFYKLIEHFPILHWRLLYNWYTQLKVLVKWQGAFSPTFTVTKGTRQGSLLSPLLFNIFIDQLLVDLKCMSPGVWIGSTHLNSFAYADDVSVFSGTAPGLQNLIDRCASYASTWRFKFGVNKTKCMITGQSIPNANPTNRSWILDGCPIETNDTLDVLGVRFSSNLSSSGHLEERMAKCRRAFYGLSGIGMTHHKVAPDVKSHLWRTICSPTLSYGLECLNISTGELKRLESLQGTLVKNSIGIGKRSRNSSLLSAMKITNMSTVIKQKTVSLLYNICQVPGPASDLCVELIHQYIRTGKCTPGTLISRVVAYDESPVHAIFHKMKFAPNFKTDGIVDSIKSMMCHSNFIKPYSIEKDLVRLLTRSF